MNKSLRTATLLFFTLGSIALLALLFPGIRSRLDGPTTVLIVNPSRGHGEFIVQAMLARFQESELLPGRHSVRTIQAPVTRDAEELQGALAELLPQADAVVAVTQFALDQVLTLRPAEEAGPGPPLFFWAMEDVVARNLVPDPSRPTRGITGVVPGLGSTPAEQLRLSYLKQIAPEISGSLVLSNPSDEDFIQGLSSFEETARELGIVLEFVWVESTEETLAALESIDQEVESIFLFGDRSIGPVQDRIYEVSRALRIPVSGPNFSSVRSGALASYSFTEESVGTILADMVIANSRGIDVSSIPVQAPEFGLAVNLSVARAVGIDVDGYLLQQAQAVYE